MKQKMPTISRRALCARQRELLQCVQRGIAREVIRIQHGQTPRPVSISEFLENCDEAIQLFGRVCRSAERRRILISAGIRTHGTKRGKFRKLAIDRNAKLTDAMIEDLLVLMQGKERFEEDVQDTTPISTASAKHGSEQDLEGAALLFSIARGGDSPRKHSEDEDSTSYGGDKSEAKVKAEPATTSGKRKLVDQSDRKDGPSNKKRSKRKRSWDDASAADADGKGPTPSTDAERAAALEADANGFHAGGGGGGGGNGYDARSHSIYSDTAAQLAGKQLESFDGRSGFSGAGGFHPGARASALGLGKGPLSGLGAAGSMYANDLPAGNYGAPGSAGMSNLALASLSGASSASSYLDRHPLDGGQLGGGLGAAGLNGALGSAVYDRMPASVSRGLSGAADPLAGNNSRYLGTGLGALGGPMGGAGGMGMGEHSAALSAAQAQAQQQSQFMMRRGGGYGSYPLTQEQRLRAFGMEGAAGHVRAGAMMRGMPSGGMGAGGFQRGRFDPAFHGREDSKHLQLLGQMGGWH
mmetsp:Transcript_37495/g.117194  ORF Transcript_37495/g.117194 Transcript_37495/m.117194 type:complete len:525 (-) Transcript_37495:98-1672(-)